MTASNVTSLLLSLLISVVLLASMQSFRTQLASSQPLTLLGGFLGSLVFVSSLTAISNFEMHTFGTSFQARIFPEVLTCLILAMICSGFVHRVCVSTCLIFSLIELYYINRLSSGTYGSSSISANPNFSTNKKKAK